MDKKEIARAKGGKERETSRLLEQRISLMEFAKSRLVETVGRERKILG